MTIYLVRHAKAGERAAWDGDDFMRPLSGRGHTQAFGLLDQLRKAKFERILSSPYVRCMETVVPLAGIRGLAVEPADALAEGQAGEPGPWLELLRLPERWPPPELPVKGRDLAEGRPKTITLSSGEVHEALTDTLKALVLAVRDALERVPPELSADIYDRGIVLTGGGALLKNLDRRLHVETSLPIMIAEEPLSSVVLGAGKMLSDLDLLKRVAVD